MACSDHRTCLTGICIQKTLTLIQFLVLVSGSVSDSATNDSGCMQSALCLFSSTQCELCERDRTDTGETKPLKTIIRDRRKADQRQYCDSERVSHRLYSLSLQVMAKQERSLSMGVKETWKRLLGTVLVSDKVASAVFSSGMSS